MIVVHHLNHSRSTRVIWLLEELGVDYHLIRHQREPGFSAPASLRHIHPLAKAPVVVDGDFVIAESAVILAYLDESYGGSRHSPARGTPERLKHDEWLHFAEGALASALMATLYGELTGGLTGTFAKIIDRDVHAALSHVASGLRSQQYLVGSDLTLADIQVSYLLDLAGYLARLNSHPEARDYYGRLQDRPAFQRAITIGGPMNPSRAPSAEGSAS